MSRYFKSAIIAICLTAPIAVATTVVTRVDSELHAMASALEDYKADTGHYPSDAATQNLAPRTAFDPGLYMAASRTLYRALSGDADGDPATKSPQDGKRYFDFKPSMLRSIGSARNTYVVDPWGNSYGYSTREATVPSSRAGYNAGAYDLWSTGGGKTDKDKKRWATNW